MYRAIPLLLAIFGVSSVQSEEWQSVPGESQLQFITVFEGMEVPGEFQRFRVNFADEGPDTQAYLRVHVDITSADMYSDELNEGIADPEWFGFQQFPSALFQSRSIIPQGGENFEARGTLQIKDSSQELSLNFQRITGDSVLVIKGETLLKRLDFNIGSGAWADDDSIGQSVRVKFDVQLLPKP